MIDREGPPDAAKLAAFLGKAAYRRWEKLVKDIEENYPAVFEGDWLYGGSKHGWGLRFKKSRAFCTLVPERKAFAVQIVFGRDERAKMAAILPGLRTGTREAYDRAPVFHDGKWLLLPVDCDQARREILQILATKRKPLVAHEEPRQRTREKRPTK